MRIVSICNHKGGTGKTTTAVHLATAFGMSDVKTLVIDLDPQSFLSGYMGFDAPKDEASSLAFFGLADSLADIPKQQARHFDFIPASYDLTDSLKRLNKPTDVFWVKEVLQNSQGYDVVLIDTSANVSIYALNALTASSVVIVPVVPEFQSLVGAEQTAKTCHLIKQQINPDLQSPYFLFTKVNAARKGHRENINYLKSVFPKHVLKTMIESSVEFGKEPIGGKTILEQKLNSKPARQYTQLADELKMILG
jgi:chromosome partitioning protein